MSQPVHMSLRPRAPNVRRSDFVCDVVHRAVACIGKGVSRPTMDGTKARLFSCHKIQPVLEVDALGRELDEDVDSVWVCGRLQEFEAYRWWTPSERDELRPPVGRQWFCE